MRHNMYHIIHFGSAVVYQWCACMKQFMTAPPIEMLDTTKADHAHRAPELGSTAMPAVLFGFIQLIMLLSAAPDAA